MTKDLTCTANFYCTLPTMRLRFHEIPFINSACATRVCFNQLAYTD